MGLLSTHQRETPLHFPSLNPVVNIAGNMANKQVSRLVYAILTAWSFSLNFNQFRQVSQPLVGLLSCLCVQGFLIVSVRLGVGQDVSMLLTNTCTCTSANWSALIPGTCTLQYNFVTNLAKEYTLSGSNPAMIYLPGPLPFRS